MFSVTERIVRIMTLYHPHQHHNHHAYIKENVRFFTRQNALYENHRHLTNGRSYQGSFSVVPATQWEGVIISPLSKETEVRRDDVLFPGTTARTQRLCLLLILQPGPFTHTSHCFVGNWILWNCGFETLPSILNLGLSVYISCLQCILFYIPASLGYQSRSSESSLVLDMHQSLSI